MCAAPCRARQGKLKDWRIDFPRHLHQGLLHTGPHLRLQKGITRARSFTTVATPSWDRETSPPKRAPPLPSCSAETCTSAASLSASGDSSLGAALEISFSSDEAAAADEDEGSAS